MESSTTQLLVERGAVDGAELKRRIDESLAASQARANLVLSTMLTTS